MEATIPPNNSLDATDIAKDGNPQVMCLPLIMLAGYLQPGMAKARPHGGGQWWGRSLLSRGCLHGHLLLHGEPVSLQQQCCFALQQGF